MQIIIVFMAGKFQSCHDFGFVGGPVLAQRCRWSDHSDVKNSNKSGEVIRVVRMREGCQYGYGYGYCNMYGVIPTSVWYDDGVEIVPSKYRVTKSVLLCGRKRSRQINCARTRIERMTMIYP